MARSPADPTARGAHGAWLRQHAVQVRRVAEGHDLRPLFALLPPCGCTPDCLKPLPRGSAGEIDLELAHVRSTAEEQMRAEVDRCLEARGPVGQDVVRLL